MTATELQTRLQRASLLRVFQVDIDAYFVESEDKKVAYKILFSSDKQMCTCADFVTRSKTDPHFICKHILATSEAIANSEVAKTNFLARIKPKLDERFICEIDGREFVKYPGLLDLGHQKGISRIDVSLLQMPSADNGNCAICRAEVESTNGAHFSDIGDASPSNCSAKVAKHFLRLASTRSIARALRSYTNIGMTCFEELGDDDVVGGNGSRQKPKLVKRQADGSTVQPLKPVAHSQPSAITPEHNTAPEGHSVRQEATESAGLTDGRVASERPAGTAAVTMSEAQKRALFSLARRRGLLQEDVDNLALEAYQCKVDELSSLDAASLIRQLQQSA